MKATNSEQSSSQPCDGVGRLVNQTNLLVISSNEIKYNCTDELSKLLTAADLEALGRRSCGACNNCTNCCQASSVVQEVCQCPSDRLGESCTDPHPFTCQFSKNEPSTYCNNATCSLDSEFTASFSIFCKQNGNFSVDESFNYTVRDGNKVKLL